ncbi:MAG: flagellar motor protein [Deltaproteobacteria bacterium]|nr:flagellar motor protein [Deltaproteobacteria bacterium]
MDIATIGGLILAWTAVVASALMEGTNMRALASVPAVLLVVVGSLGATMIGFPIQTVKNLPSILRNAFFGRKLDLSENIRQIVSLAEKARRAGILALEDEADQIKDPFLRKGVQLAVDGFDIEETRGILENELANLDARHKVGEAFFATMGGFSPTLGIIGTVLGLVNALGKLDSPSEMGEAIAAAFVATLYGVSVANLAFLPIGAKLKARNDAEMLVREAMVVGILAIEAGEAPRNIEEKLRVFLAPRERTLLDKDKKR